MFGMWRGLTRLSTCWCLLMLIHFLAHAGKKWDFLASTFLITQSDAPLFPSW